MPKGKKPKKGDYEGWILRLIDKVEDIEHSFNEKKWLDFAERKILASEFAPESGNLTQSQKDSLMERRDMIWEIAPAKLNVNPEYITRYRGLHTGRFLDVNKTPHGFKDNKTGRFVSVRPEQASRFRDIDTGKMTARAVLNQKIKELKETKSWSKIITEE